MTTIITPTCRQQLRDTLELQQFFGGATLRHPSPSLPAYGVHPAQASLKGTSFDTDLADVGYSLDRDDTDMVYVLGIVFDATLERAVGLLKLKGPPDLYGKVTFAGGKREGEGEVLEQRCSSELLEEVNLRVPVHKWRFVGQSSCVATFVARLDSLAGLRTMELEPVFEFIVDKQLDLAKVKPKAFAHDFVALLQAGREILVREAQEVRDAASA